MTAYRFRVYYEDDDTIFREIAILPSHNMNDFAKIIYEAYNLTTDGTSRIYLSNDQWQKIQLLENEMTTEKKVEVKKETGKKPASKKSAKKETPKKEVAAKSNLPMLVTFIDDPHQKFYMEYEGKQNLTFLIELTTLGAEEKKDVVFPAIVKSEGPSPMKKVELYKFTGAKVKIAEEHLVDKEDDEEELGEMGTEGEEEIKDTADDDDGGDDEEMMDEEESEFKDDFGEMDGHF